MNQRRTFRLASLLAQRPFFGLMMALLTGFTGSLCEAQVDVVKGRASVDIKPLTGAKGPEATKVLRADLNRTMMIDVSKGAASQFTARGEVNGLGVRGILLNQRGQEIFNEMFRGDWRRATHLFADRITKETTGVDGFASTRIAFISADSGHKELYVMDLDGANLEKLTQDKSISNGPSWSLDGHLIAYTSYRKGYPDIYVIDLRTGKRNRVAFFPGINTGPAFAPDGETLALTLSKDGNPEIYTLPSEGGEPKRITRTRGTETSPSWSPDGERIVYSSDDRGSPQLFIMPKVGAGDPDRVYTNMSFNTEPDWSPDGKKIAFTTRRSGQFQIAWYDFETRKADQLTLKGGEDPSWTRNSRHLIYSNGGKLFILDTATRKSMAIRTSLNKITEPAATHQ